MTTNRADPFDHIALHYAGEREYLAGTIPFIETALAAGEPVAVAVPEPNLQLLRDALDDTAERVLMVDMTRAGANPGRIISGILRDFADRHPGRRVHIVEEPTWPDRSATEYPACAQHEALINRAFAGRDAAILCPCDCAGLDSQALADSRATHPTLVDRTGHRTSEEYDPDRIFAAYNVPLDPRPRTAIERQLDTSTIENARWFAAAYGRQAGLTVNQLVDLQIAVTELATECVLYGWGFGMMRIWTEAEHLVCEVESAGRLDTPLAGHPTVDEARDRSLTAVHHVVDLVRAYTGPLSTVVRVYLRLP
ncbi:sensor histidine kinase [Glycomyces albidus]|uniref:Sensor histidine kinase n=1 Tax=Glycomyces albidus TaxID=2656774 RepID=A0A6L5G976_9ACTN|nr:sensor histidine kinase [Glycomyces albidus]MQM26166.1 sensor histidine kinase [Glycomyces albidus]